MIPNWARNTSSFASDSRHEIPPGSSLLSLAITVALGAGDAPATINYVAKPSGQPEAAFKLVRASATEILFENYQHDFPQRIIYSLKDSGKLTAAIEGTKKRQAALG